MRNNVKHILPIGDGTNKTPVNGSDWKEELKIFLCALIDVAAERFEANASKYVLNEILSVEELSARLKVPSSTIEQLARNGKIPGAFRLGKHWRFDLDILRAVLPNQGEAAPQSTNVKAPSRMTWSFGKSRKPEESL